MGLSNTGSWPTQIPFCTSAHIEQPTEQNGQTVFLSSTAGPETLGGFFGEARIRLTPSPRALSETPPTPEAFKKFRLDHVGALLGSDFAEGGLFLLFVRRVSMVLLGSAEGMAKTAPVCKSA